MPTYSETMSGGVLIGGIAGLTATKKYFPSGIEILTGGSASAFIAWSQSFSWDIYQEISSSISFSWDVGEQPLYFYRILYCCSYTNPNGNLGYNGITANSPQYEEGGCNATGIQNPDATCASVPQKQFMVQNLAARGIPDLCKQLGIQGYNWKICKVERWSRPFIPTVPDPNPNCNVLEEVPLDGISECIEFNIQTETLVDISVTVYINELFLSFVGSGDVYSGGSANAAITAGGTTPTTSSFVYASLGGSSTFGGSATVTSTWNNSLLVKMQMKIFMTLEQAFFGDNQDVPAIVAPTGIVLTNCNLCTALPTNLYIHHNLNNQGILSGFLKRNGFTFSEYLPLLYSNRLVSWVSQQHFTGTSSTNVGDEYWRFTFEFACVNEVASEPTDSFVIKLAISVLRKNLLNDEDSESKVVVVFPSVDLCGAIRNFRDDLVFSLNTQTALVTIKPSMTPQTVILYDGIGLFKSTYWLANPNLNIRLSTSSVFSKIARQDLTYILPNSVTNVQQEGAFVPVNLNT